MVDLLLEDYRAVYPAEVERVEKAYANPDAYIVPRTQEERDAFNIADGGYCYCQLEDEVVEDINLNHCKYCEYAEQGACNAYKMFKEYDLTNKTN